MSNEVETVVEVVEKVATTTRGERGELGTGSAGIRLKNMHAKQGRGLSLKTFVRDQAKAGNVDAKAWLDNKRGVNDMKRSENSVKRIAIEKNATKLAKKSKGGAGKGGGKSAVDGQAS